MQGSTTFNHSILPKILFRPDHDEKLVDVTCVLIDKDTTFESLERMGKADRRAARKCLDSYQEAGASYDSNITGCYTECGIYESLVTALDIVCSDTVTREIRFLSVDPFLTISRIFNLTHGTDSDTIAIAEHLLPDQSSTHTILEFDDVTQVATMYKTVARKVKPVALSLPPDSEQRLAIAAEEPRLRSLSNIGHNFTDETIQKIKINGDGLLSQEEEEEFRSMIRAHGKAFAFCDEEIGCVDPKVVTPLVIFTVPHSAWNLKPISVPKAHAEALLKLLQARLASKVLVPSMGPYSNRWFTVPKKDNKLRFIQDLQPLNRVSIRNTSIGPSPDEYSENFAGCAVYSIGDLYSSYDQFQIAKESRDMTAMRTPLGLLALAVIGMGHTNSVGHIVNGMNKIFADFIPHVTRPFVDDLPMKGCRTQDQDNTEVRPGVRRFIDDHIRDVQALLQRCIDTGLTLSGQKSAFGLREILAVGYVCGPQGRRPDTKKIDVIGKIAPCSTVSEVRRFLGAMGIYRSWIPHFGLIAAPLYDLLRKHVPFNWTDSEQGSMNTLKNALRSAPILVPLDYSVLQPVVLTVDTSPIAIGWALSQDSTENERRPSRFGARCLNKRQQNYGQIKRELWGMVVALRIDSNSVIGANLVIETDCLPLIGMLNNCMTPDLTMLRWIVFVRSFAPSFVHLPGAQNVVADMLSRARYYDLPCEDFDVSDCLHFSSSEKWERSENYQTVQTVNAENFEDVKYENDKRMQNVGYLLSGRSKDRNWSNQQAKKIRRLSFGFFLKNGVLWKKPKTDQSPQRVIGLESEKCEILKTLHNFAGHRGIWATYTKLRHRYWWTGMYVYTTDYVKSCNECQMYSKRGERDELILNVPKLIFATWVLDLIAMPKGRGGFKFTVLAREELSDFVEGRALRSKHTEGICKFILEEIYARYGCPNRLRADRGEMNANEAKIFMERFGVKLNLTTAYNPEANGKSERGHPNIINALMKACDGQLTKWPLLLPFALWADRATVSRTTGYAPIELVHGAGMRFPVDDEIPIWSDLSWQDPMSTEDLLAIRIRQMERREEDREKALKQLEKTRQITKSDFDKKHQYRNHQIVPGDLVLVREGGHDTQHSTNVKFARKWRGPFRVIDRDEFATYRLSELDGVQLKVRVAGKRIKLFRRRNGESVPLERVSDNGDDKTEEIGIDQDGGESDVESTQETLDSPEMLSGGEGADVVKETVL